MIEDINQNEAELSEEEKQLWIDVMAIKDARLKTTAETVDICERHGLEVQKVIDKFEDFADWT